jgi:hypothetical protein
VFALGGFEEPVEGAEPNDIAVADQSFIRMRKRHAELMARIAADRRRN